MSQKADCASKSTDEGSSTVSKELATKRSSHKGQITRFKNQLLEFTAKDKHSDLEIAKLAMKLSKFEALFIAFDEVQNQIESSCLDLESELSIREFLEDEFEFCISSARLLIEANSPKKPDRADDRSSNGSVFSSCIGNKFGFKLPVIQIPNFDGSYYKWIQFRETFHSLIHDNESIKDIHKYYYLNSYLEGEAARVLSNLEITSKNYAVAWQILCDRYNNSRQLINYHMKYLLNFDTLKETDKSLRFVVDHINKNLRALETLGLPTQQWDMLLIHLISAKLDPQTALKWEEHKTSLQEIHTLKEFFAFLRDRADLLETLRFKGGKNASAGSSQDVNHQRSNKPQTKTFIVSAKDSKESQSHPSSCLVCMGQHRVHECPVFKSKTLQDRLSFVEQHKLCPNCLRGGHNVKRCHLSACCRTCKQRHNSMLHQPSLDSNEPNVAAILSSEAISMPATSVSEVLLCTALVDVVNPDSGVTMTIRALLDSGSQSSFVTESLKRDLNLVTQPSNTNVIGIGEQSLQSNINRCNIKIFSKNTSFNADVCCLVLPTISGTLPKAALDVSHLKLDNFNLADPKFFQPSSVDMLLGADLFWSIVGTRQHSLGEGNPVLRDSKLGWLVAGPTCLLKTKSPQINCNFSNNLDVDLSRDLEKFWQLESVPEVTPLTKEEALCEQHYQASTTRTEDGRFCVKLPLREDRECLGQSYNLAKKRFLHLEARFKKQPLLKELYFDFIHEYANLGHLTEDVVDSSQVNYFLPHHPVFKQNSESTKLRVVFDASARTSSGLSVNDLQMIGPNVQDSLINILLRFRQYKYVLSGDVEKMYRQVLMDESDRNLQYILWRDDESLPLRSLKLNTVTYGFSSASFLSTRCLWQLGEDYAPTTNISIPIKEIIQKDFYVDDLLTGAETERELQFIQQEVSAALATGGFHLRKYRSNLASLLESTSAVTQADDNLMISSSTSTLGIGWVPSSDELKICFDSTPDSSCTKRSILSFASKIFDPLGLLSLCTIRPKMMLQELWSDHNVGWDDPIPEKILRRWSSFANNLHFLTELKFPRRVLINDPVYIELHCFCDASQRAYGSCIYVRSLDIHGNVQISLLCAKTRVAPIKPTTIPRLELCGALIGAKLTAAVTQALRCNFERVVYWTDSKVVIGWLKALQKTKVFVANRVSTINGLTDSAPWRYVPTSLNPADLLSRSIDPQHAAETMLWWHGPDFLQKEESQWPCADVSEVVELPEVKANPALVGEVSLNKKEILSRFSRLSTLQRCYAFVLRFIHNSRNKLNKLSGPLQTSELDNSMIVLIKISQDESFSKEINLITNQKALKSKSLLCSLTPFIDSQGLLRVGGRIAASNYCFDKKHPILLHANQHLTKLLFEHEHKLLMHAGPQHLLASVRNKYWPIGGKNLARRVARSCLVCRRFAAQHMKNIMGALPAEKLNADFPFSTIGLDMAGPFLITDRKGRGCKITKCYLCVFICFRYKCIHLEAVSEMSKDAFILALKRFIARRGVPKQIYCDNGGNFVAAAREIHDFFKCQKDTLCDFASQRGIEFRFSPVYAPHFNGQAESGVKLAKFHIRRVLGSTHLTFEELSSLFSQVEAILNSRPLCPLSPSPNDLHPLTPGHFLIGRPLTAIPSSDITNVNVHRLDRFQRLEQYRQHFWTRWSNEYIAELQQRTKWRERCRDLQINDLVLLKDDSAPPLCWRLGRVVTLFPGSDGVPRVAEVTTARGTVRRSINRMVLLPAPDDNDA